MFKADYSLKTNVLKTGCLSPSSDIFVERSEDIIAMTVSTSQGRHIVEWGRNRINGIHSSTGATLNVIKMKNNESTRRVVITGYEEERMQAEEEVRKIMKNYHTFIMKVTKDQVGLLLGDKGSTLNIFERKSGAMMTIYGDKSDADRELEIAGDREVVERGKMEMQRFLDIHSVVT